MAKAPEFIFRFTAAEVGQIESYIEARMNGRDSGWYFGDKKVFEAREQRILDELALRLPVGKSGG